MATFPFKLNFCRVNERSGSDEFVFSLVDCQGYVQPGTTQTTTDVSATQLLTTNYSCVCVWKKILDLYSECVTRHRLTFQYWRVITVFKSPMWALPSCFLSPIVLFFGVFFNPMWHRNWLKRFSSHFSCSLFDTTLPGNFDTVQFVFPL